MKYKNMFQHKNASNIILQSSHSLYHFFSWPLVTSSLGSIDFYSSASPAWIYLIVVKSFFEVWTPYSATSCSSWLPFSSEKQLYFWTECCCLAKYTLMGGRQILPRSISHFNVLMIPSVAILNANKKIMLPATIAISRGFPAAVNSTVEKLLTRCLMILDTRRKLSATHTSLMKQKAFTEPEIH